MVGCPNTPPPSPLKGLANRLTFFLNNATIATAWTLEPKGRTQAPPPTLPYSNPSELVVHCKKKLE